MLKVFLFFQTITKYLQNISYFIVAALVLTVLSNVTGNCKVPLKIIQMKDNVFLTPQKVFCNIILNISEQHFYQLVYVMRCSIGFLV